MIFNHQSHTGKILVLDLWAKIQSANQIAGFFKMQYLKKEMNYEAVFGMQANKLKISIWSCVTRHTRSTTNKKCAYVWNISRKSWAMKLIFCLQINTKVLYKFIVSLWMYVSRHTQSTQNNKSTTSFQYLNENVKDEVYFLLADKCQKFSQTDTIT